MTGYLKPHLRNANKEIKTEYRAFYCSLCHALKQAFGVSGLCNLSYELTFFIILLYSLNDDEAKMFHGCCSVTPFLSVKYIDYLADDLMTASKISILISRYEAQDDVVDRNKMISKIRANFLSKKTSDIEKQSFMDDVSNSLKNFYSCEKSRDSNFNQIVEAAGDIVESLIKPLTDNLSVNNTILFNEISNTIGKWIYVVDALDDYHKDVARGEFNPFTLDDSIEPNIVLNELEKKIQNLISSLPVKHYKKLINHIVYFAIPNTSNQLLSKIDINIK